jgi:hypothetical protein
VGLLRASQSNFRVETTLAFSNCAPIIIPK